MKNKDSPAVIVVVETQMIVKGELPSALLANFDTLAKQSHFGFALSKVERIHPLKFIPTVLWKR